MPTQSNTPNQNPHETWTLSQPVFFVGFMGAGKSTVARRLARRFKIPAVDIDSYIERSQGKKTKEIFSDVGEQGFREIEHEVLKEVSTLDPCFISCGGGIITLEKNRHLLKQAGFVVYLKVDVDESVQRISNLSTRPLLQNIEEARKLGKARLPLYREVADATINTAGKTSGHVLSLVQRTLKREGILCQAQK